MNDPLIQPAGLLARPIEPLHPEDSLHRAAFIIRTTVGHVAPVTAGGRYIGVVSESSLEQILAEGIDLTNPVVDAVVSHPTIAASATGAEVLRVLQSSNVDQLVVVSQDQQAIGLISASDLFPRKIPRPVPAMIGGMATPFGVYLTNGSVSGGVSRWALIATGAVMGAMFVLANVITSLVYPFLPKTDLMSSFGNNVLPYLLFLLQMRLFPISGTHAAEHQTVHALERNEELEPDVIKRMPRVHPRCGTNIAVGFSLFSGVFLGTHEWIPDESFRFLLALIVTAFTFRPLGGLVQWAITTKPATDKQIQSGIKAGKELLDNYAKNRRVLPSPFERILNMGILQLFVGSASVILPVQLISDWLQLSIGL